MAKSLQSPAQAQPSALSSPVPSLDGGAQAPSGAIQFREMAPQDPNQAPPGAVPPVVQGPEAPGAVTGASPSGTPSPDASGLSADDQALLQESGAMSADDKKLLSDSAQLTAEQMSQLTKPRTDSASDKEFKATKDAVLSSWQVGARLAGAVGGEMAGAGMFPPAGAVTGPIGAGVGAASLGAVADKVTDYIRVMDGIPPKNRDAILTAMSDMLITAGGGLAFNTLLKSVMVGAEGASTLRAAGYAGSEAGAGQSAQLSSDAQSLGMPLMQNELHPSSVEAQATANQIAQKDPQGFINLINARKKQMMDTFEQIKTEMSHGADLEAGNISDLKGFFNGMEEFYTNNIKHLMHEAEGHARSQTFDAERLLGEMRQHLGSQQVTFNPDGSLKSMEMLPGEVRQLGVLYNRMFERAHAESGAFGEVNQLGRPRSVLGTHEQNYTGTATQQRLSSTESAVNMHENLAFSLDKGGSPVGKPPFTTPDGRMTEVSPEKTSTMAGAESQDFSGQFAGQQQGLPGDTSVPQGLNPSQANMPPKAAGEARRGLTLGEMEKLRKDLDGMAGFNSNDPSSAQLTAREMYRAAVDSRDDVIKQVFLKTGKYEQANELRMQRDFYKEHVSRTDKLGAQVEQDPSSAAEILLKPNKPEQARIVMSLLNPSQQKMMKSAFLDHVAKGFKETGADYHFARTFGAKEAQAKWVKIDPKVKDAIYSGEEQEKIDRFFNVARAVDAKTIAPEMLSADPLLKQLALTLQNPKAGFLRAAYRMVTSAFKSPNVRNFIDARYYMNPSAAQIPAQAAEAGNQLRNLQLLQKIGRKAAPATGAILNEKAHQLISQ